MKGKEKVEEYFLAGAVICAVAGAVCDVRQRRIPNRLAYTSFLLGLGVRAVLAGGRGFLDGVAGGLACGAVFFVFFLVKGIGAGDVKLMAAVGAWTGLGCAANVLIATALAGGILAIGYVIAYRRVARTVRNLGGLLRHHLTSGVRPHPESIIAHTLSIRVPYAVAIALGSLYALGQSLLRG
jgi:prepilin peptidase CpaA